MNMSSLTKKALQDLQAYRAKYFQVSSRKGRTWEESEIILDITTNGSQWTSIGLLKEEIPKVISELQKHL